MKGHLVEDDAVVNLDDASEIGRIRQGFNTTISRILLYGKLRPKSWLGIDGLMMGGWRYDVALSVASDETLIFQ